MLTAPRICQFVFLCVLVLTGGQVKSQTASIHIQSELPRQYSVQWNGNSYQSSDAGYLEIPEVPAGKQLLIIGFPEKIYRETAFTCSVADKAKGFSLILGIDNNWTLFDMVDYLAMKGVPAAGLTIDKPVSPVASGPGEGKKQEPKIPGVRKLFDKAGPAGIDQVYLIDNNGKIDTIALFIPVLEETKPKESAWVPASAKADPLAGHYLYLTPSAATDPRNHRLNPKTPGILA
jgi:hypothetical protein